MITIALFCRENQTFNQTKNCIPEAGRGTPTATLLFIKLQNSPRTGRLINLLVVQAGKTLPSDMDNSSHSFQYHKKGVYTNYRFVKSEAEALTENDWDVTFVQTLGGGRGILNCEQTWQLCGHILGQTRRFAVTSPGRPVVLRSRSRTGQTALQSCFGTDPEILKFRPPHHFF